MKQSISCDSSLEESVQRHQALGNRMGPPGKKTKQRFTEPVWGQQAGRALTGQAGQHQAASRGLPPLELLSFTENHE